MQETTLKTLVKTYFDSQQYRIRMSHRLSRVQNIDILDEPVDLDNVSDALDTECENLDAFKEDILKALSEDCENIDKIKANIQNVLETGRFDIKKFKEHLSSERKKEQRCASSEGFGNTCKRAYSGYEAIEKDLVKEMNYQMVRYPISQWLVSHRGIGTVFAAGLIAYIGDIERFGTVSKLWQYAGMGVVEICQDCGKRVIRADRGAWIMHTADRLQWANDKVLDKSKKKSREELVEQATSYVCLCEHPHVKVQSQKRMAGQLVDYNPDFKKLCYLIGDQFIKQTESPYRKLYDQYKLEYMTRPDLIAEAEGKRSKNGGKKVIKGQEIEVKGTAHINAMARRKTVKIFLSHLWEEWRTIEELSTPSPYAFDVLGHADKIERARIVYK